MTKTVRCFSRMSLSSVSWIAASVSASTAEVLSSRISSRGSMRSAPGYGNLLPLTAREPDAPLTDNGVVAIREPPANSPAWAASAAATISSSVAPGLPKATLSRTVPEKRRVSCRTIPIWT